MIVLLPSQQKLKDELIAHFLHMKTLDIDYSRYALMREHERMPWMGLMEAMRAVVAKEAK